jgi:hypothetical protein
VGAVPNTMESVSSETAIPAEPISSNSATKMPITIASCWSEPRRPRRSAGAISAMYAGTRTLAIPTPMPPTIRHTMSSSRDVAAPVPIALTRNSSAATRIIGTRPSRSASGPANQAPTANRSKCGGDRESDLKGARREVALDRADRAVDHRRVEAEEESAVRSDGGYDRDPAAAGDGGIRRPGCGLAVDGGIVVSQRDPMNAGAQLNRRPEALGPVGGRCLARALGS